MSFRDYLNEAEKIVLVRFANPITDDFKEAWLEVANKNLKVEFIDLYNDYTMKVKIIKGSMAAVKRLWAVNAVQKY